MSEDVSGGSPREVPVDWEALEDAFENNAPEVHSYLHLATGEVLRVVDGVADPQMHVRISSDANYLRIDPVSSREQYRWMERFIPMVDDVELRGKLMHAIDGKGAFRRFKDVLMTYGPDRERWFTFRSERLRTFMEAWLNAHAIKATPRPAWTEGPGSDEVSPDSLVPSAIPSVPVIGIAPPSSPNLGVEEAPKSQSGRRAKTAEASRTHLKEIAEALGPRELETLVAFAEFLKARRAARGFQHHHEHQTAERESRTSLTEGASKGTPQAGSV
jgi:hypothetical protein